MHAEAPLIDEIVRRVLSQLGTGSLPAREALPTIPSPAAASGVVMIETPIVTQGVIEQSIGAATRVRVLPRAIVTPSARDFIRQRGIEIIRESAPDHPPGQVRGIVFVTAAPPQVAAAIESLRADGIYCEKQLLGTAAEAAGEATSALCRGETAVVAIVTGEPELAACLANRNARIRATPLSSLPALAAIRATFNPNLFAINPAGKSQFELRQLLKEILRT
ncbi:MAG: hypothetical protein EXS05_14595 [Planctomycetaceae bacterium]|nr:hypothetical protein [Planctomycetaceae bacterium]